MLTLEQIKTLLPGMPGSDVDCTFRRYRNYRSAASCILTLAFSYLINREDVVFNVGEAGSCDVKTARSFGIFQSLLHDDGRPREMVFRLATLYAAEFIAGPLPWTTRRFYISPRATLLLHVIVSSTEAIYIGEEVGAEFRELIALGLVLGTKRNCYYVTDLGLLVNRAMSNGQAINWNTFCIAIPENVNLDNIEMLDVNTPRDISVTTIDDIVSRMEMAPQYNFSIRPRTISDMSVTIGPGAIPFSEDLKIKAQEMLDTIPKPGYFGEDNVLSKVVDEDA